MNHYKLLTLVPDLEYTTLSIYHYTNSVRCVNVIMNGILGTTC